MLYFRAYKKNGVVWCPVCGGPSAGSAASTETGARQEPAKARSSVPGCGGKRTCGFFKAVSCQSTFEGCSPPEHLRRLFPSPSVGSDYRLVLSADGR